VRVRNLGVLAKASGDAAVDEAKDRDRPKGDSDNGTVGRCERYYIIQAPVTELEGVYGGLLFYPARTHP